MKQNKYYRVKRVVDNEYYILESCDGDIVTQQIKDIDKLASVFTIRDAKDGDVLAADECYVIFKEIDGLNIKCYCTYHYIGFNPIFFIDTLQNTTTQRLLIVNL